MGLGNWIKRGVGAAMVAGGVVTMNPALMASGGATIAGTLGGDDESASPQAAPSSVSGSAAASNPGATPAPFFYPPSVPHSDVRTQRKSSTY